MTTKYEYLNARHQKQGTMVCTICNQKVLAGEYRSRETDTAFHVQHRACCRDDKQWAKLDAHAAAHRLGQEAKLKAYEEFRDNWTENALDEEISQIKEYLERDRKQAIEDMKFR